MYLEKLKLAGFKSFADRVEMQFSQGISAIVGPNGSGKSNITDAIRWVLGEQSTKSLRGKKMEDVIFSGTEKIAPKNFAEVTLIMNNSAGLVTDQPDEIAVTRRLFRSGDSEYRMNGKACKLRDIHALFMDTGLGKNGYSLISQGGIESIISASPLELRGIVEEAVGIVSYKTKKQEAEKRLDNTEKNLERLTDILEEIEKQLKPLKRQAGKAKEYLTIRDEMKQVDLIIFHRLMAETGEKLTNLQKEMGSVDAELTTLQNKIDEKDALFLATREKLQEIARTSGTLAEEIETLRAGITEDEKTRVALTGSIEFEQRDEERLTGELSSLEQERESLNTRLTALQTEATEMTGAVAKTEEAQAVLKHKRNKALGDLEMEQILQSEALDRRSEENRRLAELNEERLRLQTELTKHETEDDFRRRRYAESEAEMAACEKILADLAVEQEENKRLLTKLSAEVEGGRRSQGATQRRAAELKAAMDVAANNLQVNISKRDYLKGLQESYTDYYPAIREIMKPANLGSLGTQVYGPVGELIAMPERLATAIDVALGNKSQNIVVETVDTASRCIDLLKQKRAGRATFLPLDNLRVATMSAAEEEKLKALPGAVGIASSLVTTAGPYRRAVESLLGRTIIAESFVAAKRIQQQGFSRYTIVTLDGEIFYSGGAIVGGFNQKGKKSPLFKKAEIQKYDQEIRSLENEVADLKRESQAAEEEFTRLAATVQKTSGRLASLERESWQIDQNLEEQQKQKKTLTAALEAFSEAGSRQREDELQAALAANEQAIAELQAKVGDPSDGGDDQLGRIRSLIDAVNHELSEVGITLARQQEGLKALESQITSVTSALATNEEKSNNLREQISAATAKRKELIQRDADLSLVIDAKKTQIDEKTAELGRYTENTRAETDLSERLNSEVRELGADHAVLKDKRNELELARNKLEAEVKYAEENIYEAYEMNYIMAADYLEGLDTEKIDASSEHQRELKNKIAALGNVNVGAIEEYAELNTRYTFMKEQVEDLEAAKKEILTVIAELYDSMELQFASQFKRLQEKFSRIFGVLFEGGKAHIEYTDPDNVLESGIELHAQPPGKNLRHISLLSGGEKSMIAISLLFSFIELNPSPFSVIDEIDAALDDRNIYRFTAYLKQIAHNNQFIIITHRKTTLEACDAIYGVSMAKNGVSKLVSMRLSDYIEPTG